jgi:aromatic ring-opening dioxygenase catalytic subunit (LigB family)
MPKGVATAGISRREVGLIGLAGVAGALSETGCHSRKETTMTQSKLPVVYVPHGGGPFTYVDLGAPRSEVDALWEYWKSVGALVQPRPKALLVVSAHWEEPVPTLMTAEQPPLFFDYYGFPDAAYALKWAAPGAPWLAERVQQLLLAAGIASAVDAKRGFDHGTFVPLGRSFPEADIPTTQLSLKRGLDPREHLALGRALSPLRAEGVFIVGSGMSYHNMRGFGSLQGNADAEQFDAWLQNTVALPAAERDAQLAAWEQAPAARRVPREEHFLPLRVVAGAAGEDRGVVPFSGKVLGKQVSAVHFS